MTIRGKSDKEGDLSVGLRSMRGISRGGSLWMKRIRGSSRRYRGCKWST